MKPNLEKKIEKIKLLFRIQDYQQAELLLDSLFKENPGLKIQDGWDALHIATLYKQNKIDATIAALKSAIEENPSSTELTLCLAVSLCDQGSYEEAGQILSNAKSLGFVPYKKRLEGEFHRKISELQQFLGSSDLSLKNWSNYTLHETASLETELQIASYFLENRKILEAITLLNSLLSKYENSSQIRTLLGLAYYIKNEKSEADKAWRAALAKNPKAREPRIFLDNLED